MTATDEPALLRAILADPGDDTVRLAYADWLEEHGQPERAEFIRVQVALPRTPENTVEKGDVLARRADGRVEPYQGVGTVVGVAVHAVPNPRYKELCRRERDLVESLRPHFVGTLPPITCAHAWSTCSVRHFNEFRDDGGVAGLGRGFVEAVSLSAADWLAHGDAIRRQHPVTRVVWTALTAAELDEMSLRAWAISPTYTPARHLLSGVCAVLWPGVVFEFPHITVGAGQVLAATADGLRWPRRVGGPVRVTCVSPHPVTPRPPA